MQMDDDVFHFRIVNSALSVRSPGIFSRCKIRIDTNKVEVCEIGKF